MSNHTGEYGILERCADTTVVSPIAERIRLLGFAVVSGGYSEEQLSDLRRRFDRVLEQQTEEFGADRLDAIGDRHIARCLLAYDETFLTLATHPIVLGVARELVGDYVVLMQQNGILNPPGEEHSQQAYHRDLPYQHFVSSRPLAVSALFCIDPFTVMTGATTVIPASHRIEAFPSSAVEEGTALAVDAEAGSFIIFDSMLFHRAGVNRSGHARRGVNHVFTIPLLRQQISLPAALQGRYADDPALAQLLGYDVSEPGTVVEWRQRRREKKSR